MTDPNADKSAVVAACGAYLLVALSDARLDRIEEARFLDGVVHEPVFARFAAESLAAEYNRLRGAVEADYDSAEAEILTAIALYRSDKAVAAAVREAARQAIIADQELKPQEDLALSRIARALGIAPEDL
jgi:tellurite resistance protein